MDVCKKSESAGESGKRRTSVREEAMSVGWTIDEDPSMMERAGQFLTQCDGARYGNFIWGDPRGSYEVDGETGVSEFFFHQEKPTTDNAFIIRCKKWRNPTNCPVRGKISRIGEIQKLTGVHNHRPEYNGQGIKVLRSRGNWIRSLRSNPQQSISDAVAEERRRLPMEGASQIVLKRHFRTAQRHRAAVKSPGVCDVLELRDVIGTLPSSDFNITTDNERLGSFRCEHPDGIILTSSDHLECLSLTAVLKADATYRIVKDEVGEVAVGDELKEGEATFAQNAYTEWNQWVIQQALQHDHEYDVSITNHQFGDHSYGLPL